MKSDKVRFSALRRLLEEHGFRMGNALGSHRVFLRPSDQSLLFFPPLNPTDSVPPQDLAATARLLDDRGVMRRDDFDSALRRSNGGTHRESHRKSAPAHA